MSVMKRDQVGPITIEVEASDLHLAPGVFPEGLIYRGAWWRRIGTVGTYHGDIDYAAYVEVPSQPDPMVRPRLLHVWND